MFYGRGPILALFAAAALLFGTAITEVEAADNRGESVQTGGMEAMAIDMDVSGNTATSLGSRQECSEALPGSTVTVDVTARNIPSSNPMLAYSYTLIFDVPGVAIVDQEPMMILSAPGSSSLNASEDLPAFEGRWTSTLVDLGPTPDSLETGSGVLDQITIEVSTDAAPRIYSLGLTAAAHIDDANVVHPAKSLLDSRLAIGVSCNASTPVPPHTEQPQDGQSPTPVTGQTSSAAPTSTPEDTDTPDTRTPQTGDQSPTPTLNLVTPMRTPQGSESNDAENGEDGGGAPFLPIAAVIAGVGAASALGWYLYRRRVRGVS